MSACHDVYRAAINVGEEKLDISIAENQPLKIPSFCTRDHDLPIPFNANQSMTKSNVSIYYWTLLVVHSFTLHTVKTESSAER